MATNYYVFVDRFTVPCNAETAFRYISRIEAYPGWWGKVYKKVNRLNDVPDGQAGARYALVIGGFLPYTLNLENEITLTHKPLLIEFSAKGDLEGKGIWTFRKGEGGTEITFDWRVAAHKSFIRWFSFLLKPLFRANHAYCVRNASEGIRKDLVIQKNQAASL